MNQSIEFRSQGDNTPWATLQPIGDCPILDAARKEVFPDTTNFPDGQTAGDVEMFAEELCKVLADTERQEGWKAIDPSESGLHNARGWAIAFHDLCKNIKHSTLTLVGPVSATAPDAAPAGNVATI